MKREDDAEERRHHPEVVPVPIGWEQTAYRAETTETLGTVGREEILEVADISAEDIPTIFHPGREALEESVGLGNGLIIVAQRRLSDTNGEVGGERHVQSVGGTLALPCHNEDHVTYLHRVGTCLGSFKFVAEDGLMIVEIAPCGHFLSVDRHYAVAAS